MNTDNLPLAPDLEAEYDRILAEADQEFHAALHPEEGTSAALHPEEHARGRPKKYVTQEEKTEAQRKNALLHYHRKKALCHYLKTAPAELANGDIFTVHVKFSSSRLGVVEEDVQYRVINKDKELYQKLT